MANKITSQLSNKFSELPPWAKGVVTLSVIAGVVYVIFKVNKAIKKDAHEKEAKEIEQEITELTNVQKQSYPDSQYHSFANQLEQAMYDFGTDEEGILAVFNKLKNNLDYLKLKKAFGVRPYMGGFIPPVLTGQNYDMVEHLRQELSSSWIKRINDLLAKKKITYRV